MRDLSQYDDIVKILMEAGRSPPKSIMDSRYQIDNRLAFAAFPESLNVIDRRFEKEPPIQRPVGGVPEIPLGQPWPQEPEDYTLQPWSKEPISKDSNKIAVASDFPPGTGYAEEIGRRADFDQTLRKMLEEAFNSIGNK